jgi:hypothetical protein
MRRVALAVLVACAACADAGGTLDLSLYTPAADEQDPFEGVRLLRAQVNVPGAANAVPPQLFDVSAGVGRVTGVPLARFVTVVVEGLSGVDGQPVSRGFSPPVDLVSGARHTVPLFFAKVDRFASGVSVATGKRIDLRDGPRAGHTATLLKDGRVLVTGGAVLSGAGGVESDPRASAEIYDPATGEWTAAGGMGFPRAFHTATLLKDGRVLVVGGMSFISGTLSPLATAEVFDPAGPSFRPAGSLREERGRSGHTATLLPDGRVLVTGGFGQGSRREALATAEVFDPARGAFFAVGPMSAARTGHTATLLLDGRLLVAGGRGDAGALAETEIFATPTDAFIPGPALPDDARAGHSAVRLTSGAVLVAGGCTRPESLAASVSAMSGSGCHTREALQTVLSRVDLYDPSTAPAGRFLAGIVPNLVVPRADHTAVPFLGDARMLVGGGLRADASSVAVAEVFEDQGGGRFGRRTAVGELRAARTFHTATRLSSGLVLISGGLARSGPSFSVVSGVELYTP